jgi:hypothetical protein
MPFKPGARRIGWRIDPTKEYVGLTRASGMGSAIAPRAVAAAGKGEMHMAGKNTAAFGLYSDRVQVEQGIDALLAARFRSEDISVLFPDNEGSKDFAHEKNTKAPEGAAAGAGAGGAIGGTLGLLVGIGALAIPGLGPFIAAGPIVAALAGMGAGGAVGGFVGALVGMGIPEYEAKRYDGRVRQGGILVSVHCDNSEWVARAEDILKQTGAEDIASAGEASSDYGKTDKPLARDPLSETAYDHRVASPRTRSGSGSL